MGDVSKHIDLDCQNKSKKFNPNIFYDILQPKNYPLARFPSNPEFSLAFMQQVAVNLAIGFDNEQIRSVNGPPGTGKTTLLKDIFSELIVEQSREIAFSSLEYIKGANNMKYWDNACIGILPKSISDKGIVVASSNHGAVQNIVDELPLNDKVDKEFIDCINDIDYFKKIANSKVWTEWVEENGRKKPKLKIKENKEKNKLWGLFSIEGGKKDNMEYIINVLKHVENYLEKEYTPNDRAYQEFIELYKKVLSYREKVQDISEVKQLSEKINEKEKKYENEFTKKKEYLCQFSSNIDEEDKTIKRIEHNQRKLKLELEKIKIKKEDIDKKIEEISHRKPKFLLLFSRSRRKELVEEKNKLQNNNTDKCMVEQKLKEIKNELDRLKGDLKKHKEKLAQEQKKFNRWSDDKISEINYLKDEKAKRQNISLNLKIKEINLDESNETVQLSNPWFNIEYRRLQSQLFIKALQVRKQFLYKNIKNIKAAHNIWSSQKKYLEKKYIISEAWNWINMVIPVIGSTFASFSRMFENIEQETIGHLFIDEAGQALPQASVGAIFRSKYVMAVGDPSQIKPVLTVDSNILNILREYYEVSDNYLSDTASTQTLIDTISQYGFYKDDNKESWIGIPLWVHRRCKYPMFDISNNISYGGNMVQGDKKCGNAKWYDISGCADDKYVKEQGKFLKEKIQEMIKENPDILDKKKKDIIYVISPFKNVADQISIELDKIGFTRRDSNNKPTNVGTVHTFQGKEAPIVFLVLGADKKSMGAANWATGTSNPNIMNVAATRAKNEFYIIGDKKLYLELNSDVINKTYKIIEEYNLKR